MLRIGRTSTPGWCASTSSMVMPRWRLSSVPVRHRTYIQSAKLPSVIQIFWPLSTQPSPSRSARVRSDARSDPAFGSLKPWPQNSSARADRREETALLRVGAVQQQRRPEEIAPVHAHPVGGPCPPRARSGTRAPAWASRRGRRTPRATSRSAISRPRARRSHARRTSQCASSVGLPTPRCRGTHRRGARGAIRAARRGTLRRRGRVRCPSLLVDSAPPSRSSEHGCASSPSPTVFRRPKRAERASARRVSRRAASDPCSGRERRRRRAASDQ